MTLPLPTNRDATYADSGSDPSVKVHQQDHDAIGAAVNGAVSTRVPFLRPAIGSWLAQHGANFGTFTPPAGEMTLGPLWLPGGTYDAVLFRVDGAGSAGAVAKVVAYLDNGGIPGTLALETAAVDCTTTGNKTITGLTFVVPSSGQMYHAGTVTQGAPTTLVRYWKVSQTGGPLVWSGTPDMTYSPSLSFVTVGVTGAAPTTPGTNGADGHTRLAFRRSA